MATHKSAPPKGRPPNNPVDFKARVISLLGKRADTYVPLMTTWAEVQCTQRAYEAVQSASLVDQNPTLDAQTPRNVHYVRGIVNAMKSTRHAIDAFKPVAKGQAAQIGRHTAFILKLSDLEIQLVAWSVLKRIYLACKGIYVRPAVGNVQLLPEPEKHSFDLHLAYVLSILRKSKVVCYQLCERSTWYDRLAMRPGADLNNLNASIESDAGPKPAKYQHGHAAWQKMMGIRPNSSKRRTGKPDPKVIRAALPNVFSKKSRPSKRPSKQGNTKTASKATKQPRTARAQSSRSASVQLHDAAVNQTQTMQPPPHPAPMIPPHPPLAFVPSPEERNQMALAHLPRNQFEQIRVGEHFDNGVAIDPALQFHLFPVNEAASGFEVGYHGVADGFFFHDAWHDQVSEAASGFEVGYHGEADGFSFHGAWHDQVSEAPNPSGGYLDFSQDLYSN